MYQRFIISALEDALKDSPIVLLLGARQTGKSTLAEQLLREGKLDRYITLDNLTFLASAKADPSGFIQSIQGRVAIDEIQRAPEIFLPLKAAVDKQRNPGRFLLTGSTNVMALPTLADTLAGRMEIHILQPLTQAEIESQKNLFVDKIFAPTPLQINRQIQNSEEDIFIRLLRGGYPEVMQRPSEKRREAWFSSYIIAVLQREIRELANIDGITELPKLLKLIASRVCGLLNFSDLARDMTMPQTTLKRYLDLLQSVFLVQVLPAWNNNRGQRLVKAPKLLLNDTGLAGHLLGVESLTSTHPYIGKLFELFVLQEIIRQTPWAQKSVTPMHFRSHDGKEVDLVLEQRNGTLVGIEVKFAAQVNKSDFKGLIALQETAGKNFHCGIVIYRGHETVPFGPDLWAVPVTALWKS